MTPCFPSYPSNHDSAANGATAVLRRLYGDEGLSITLSNPAVPNIVLQYTSFRQITDDIADARVYSGSIFEPTRKQACVWAGLSDTAVFKNNLLPVHNGD